MGWMDHQDRGSQAKAKVEVQLPELEIQLDGEHWIPVNKNCVDKCYTDEMPRLLIVVDEIAELTGKSGLKTTEGKAEDALKDEIISNIQSITQLGRSAGTQRNDAALDYNYELIIKRNGKLTKIKWFELEIGDEFDDGSKCTYLSNWFNDVIYGVYIGNEFITASAGHLLKVDIMQDNKKMNDLLELNRSIEARNAVNETSTDWISVEDLDRLKDKFEFISNGNRITKISKKSESKVRCIQTNTGKYKIKDFISHNTVLPGIIQNNPLSIDTLVEVKD